CSGVTFQ
nr:Chain B, peptide [Severe acute respiratory syndrome coronavirus 2]